MVALLENSLAGPTRPLGSPEIPQFFAPGAADAAVYRPWLYGAAAIHFVDAKRKLDETRRVAFRVPLAHNTRVVDWEAAESLDLMADQLLTQAPAEASYQPLPAGAMELKTFTRWAKNLDRWLARTQRLAVTPAPEEQAPATIGPKRGGVSVELVAILWELT